jgi:hypothetical protein
MSTSKSFVQKGCFFFLKKNQNKTRNEKEKIKKVSCSFFASTVCEEGCLGRIASSDHLDFSILLMIKFFYYSNRLFTNRARNKHGQKFSV